MKWMSFFSLLFFISFNQITAQTVADALRFSQFGIGGTARTAAIGGSIGALGADFPVVGTNPAGLGAYRSSEFTMTPSLFLSNIDANLEGGGSGAFNETTTNFNFSNIGIVFGRVLDNGFSKWKTANFSIGIHRLANFNEDFFYSGATTGSYVDFFQDASTGLFPNELNDFDTGPAFDVGAIFDIEEDGFYETDVELAPNEPIQKQERIRRSGSINEVVASGAGMLGDKLLLGATLGIPIVSYSELREYSEDDNQADNIPFFRDLSYTQDLETTGFGINLKLGAIYRISQALRLGAAIHTPTRLRLTDDFQTTLLYDFIDGSESGPLETSSPQSNFDYDLRTPWRFIASGGLVVGRQGFISAEVEYLNYGGAEFKEPRLEDGTSVNTGFFDDLNEDVSAVLASAVLFRVGGELVVAENFRIRAGVNSSTNPFEGEDGLVNTNYSAGIGYRARKFFIDAAYILQAEDANYSPYSVGGFTPQIVNLNNNKNSLLLTLGFRF